MPPNFSARLRRSLASLRGDLRAATAGLHGRQPPPFHPRDGSAWVTERSAGSGTEPSPALPDRVQLPTTTCRVSLLGPGAPLHLVVRPGQTILAAARQADLDPPHSCAVGGCGTCRHELISGRVVMRQPNCLTTTERAAGSVLICVAHPLEPTVLRRR